MRFSYFALVTTLICIVALPAFSFLFCRRLPQASHRMLYASRLLSSYGHALAVY